MEGGLSPPLVPAVCPLAFHISEKQGEGHGIPREARVGQSELLGGT